MASISGYESGGYVYIHWSGEFGEAINVWDDHGEYSNTFYPMPPPYDEGDDSYATSYGYGWVFSDIAGSFDWGTPPPTYHYISASAGSHGTIDPTGSVQVVEGNDQGFNFYPDSGYEVDVVTVDGTPQGGHPSNYTFYNVTTDHTINVTFKVTITALVKLAPDTEGLAESPVRRAKGTYFPANTLGLTDILIKRARANYPLSDALILTDVNVRRGWGNYPVVNTLSLTDTSTKREWGNYFVPNTLSLNDGFIKRALSKYLSANALGLSDYEVGVAEDPSFTDILHITETSVRKWVTYLSKFANNALTLTDTLLKRAWANYVTGNTLSITESLSKLGKSVYNSLNIVALTETLGRRLVSNRLVTDALGITEGLSKRARAIYNSLNTLLLEEERPANLLANGDFEDGDPPTGWYAYNCTASRESGIVKSGTYSAKAVGAGVNPWELLMQDLPNPSQYLGRKLTLGGWCYAPSTNVNSSLLIIECWYNDWVDYTNSYVTIPKDDDWHWLSTTLTVPNNVTNIRPSFYIDPTGGHSTDILYCDKAFVVVGDYCPEEVQVRRLWSTRLVTNTIALVDSLMKRARSIYNSPSVLGIVENITRRAKAVYTLVSNAVGLIDSAIGVRENVFFTEVVNITETLVHKLHSYLNKFANDILSLSETLGRRATALYQSSNIEGITETLVKRAVAIYNSFNTVALVDTLARRLISTRFVSDIVSITEGLTRRAKAVYQSINTEGLQEGLVRILTSTRIVSDTLGLAEGLIRRLSSIRLSLDTEGISEAVGRRLSSIRTVTSNTVGLIDSVLGIGENSLSVEVIHITETLLNTLHNFLIKFADNVLDISEVLVRKAIVIYLSTNLEGIADSITKRMISIRVATSNLIGLLDSTLGVAENAVGKEIVSITETLLSAFRAFRFVDDIIDIPESLIKRARSIRLSSNIESLTDTIKRRMRSARFSLDTEGIAEGLAKRARAIYFSANIEGLQEALIHIYHTVKFSFNTESIVDTAAIRFRAIRLAPNVVKLTENLLKWVRLSKLVSETINITESMANIVMVYILQFANNTVNLTEGLIRRGKAIYFSFDPGNIAEDVIRLAKSIRFSANTEGITEGLTRRLQSVYQSVSTLGIFETPVRRLRSLRFISDTLNITESLVHQIYRIVVVLEQVAIHDMALFRMWSTKIIFETIRVLDNILQWFDRILHLLVGASTNPIILSQLSTEFNITSRLSTEFALVSNLSTAFVITSTLEAH